jgi:hypothetical protein
MKFYVIHYSKNTDRRAQLEKQLKDFDIVDVEWITEYDKEDPIIEKIKRVTNSPLDLKSISCSMKHYSAMEKMVREDIPEAVILEDDVVFLEEFRSARMYHPCGLLRLGLGVGVLEAKIPPASPTQVYQVANPGGSEATWLTQQFALVAIKNVNFDNTIDMIQFSLLKHFFNEKLRLLVTAYQTSIMVPSTGKKHDGSWLEYCENFLNYKRWALSDLKEKAR